MDFLGKEHMRTKMFKNGKIIEQVWDFNYLGCNISYYEWKEVNNKVNNFQRMCRTLKGKTQLSTEIKFYKVMAVPILMYGSENLFPKPIRQ